MQTQHKHSRLRNEVPLPLTQRCRQYDAALPRLMRRLGKCTHTYTHSLTHTLSHVWEWVCLRAPWTHRQWLMSQCAFHSIHTLLLRCGAHFRSGIKGVSTNWLFLNFREVFPFGHFYEMLSSDFLQKIKDFFLPLRDLVWSRSAT